MKILVAGTFDNFHIGHQWLIWSAKAKGESLVIIVARDKTVTRIKGSAPKNQERARMGRVLVDLVSTQHTTVRLGRKDADFWVTIAEESPDMIYLGYDQHFDEVQCAEKFPHIKIERCSSYAPEIFESSKF